MYASVSSELLRRHCPCATCREARGEGSHDAPLTPASKKKPGSLSIVQSSLSEELNLLEVWPVGNYAIGMRWGDGHATGIYTFELLRQLTESSLLNTKGNLASQDSSETTHAR